MLSQFYRLPLAAKCGVIAAGIAGTACLALLLVSLTAGRQILLETTSNVGAQWARQLASQSQQALLRQDRVSLQAILHDYTNSPLVSYGSIRNADGDTLAESGEWRDDNLNFHANASGDGSLGDVRLSLDRDYISREINDLGKVLLLLTAAITALAFALAAMPGRRVEEHLRQARERLAQPLRDDHSQYPGRDSLGALLREIHAPQIRLLDAGKDKFSDYYLLHCHWQHWDTLKEQMTGDSFREQVDLSRARAEAIARLYHAELFIHRHNAISLRFFEVKDTDAPLFRALCCANLFAKLDKLFKCRPGIARVCGEGDNWKGQALESETLERLHIATAEGTQIWLDNNCQNQERLDAWVKHRGQRASGMKPPYDELLERQQVQLQKLDLASLQIANDGDM